MTSTWSNEKFDKSQEEDNMVSNKVAFTDSLFLDNRVLVQESVGFVATDAVNNTVIPKAVATKRMTIASNQSGPIQKWR